MIKNTFDLQFINMCNTIISNGWNDGNTSVRTKWKDGTSAHTIKTFGVCNTYDLQKEFPITTLRPLNWKSSIDEILWIFQRKSNKLKDLNSKIWTSWATKSVESNELTINKSYGYQLARKINFPEGEMDQVDWILHNLKTNPYNRRMITNIFNHDDLKDMPLYPCAWSVSLCASNGALNMVLNQRSQDILVANSWNVFQYSILLTMFAIHAGLQPGKLLHVIADAHIYDRHIPIVQELIQRETFKPPTLIINKDIKNYYDFKVEDFQLEGYNHGKSVHNIEVAI